MWNACLAGLVSVGAGLFLRSEYEKSHFVTEHFRICSDKIKEGERNFVFLTDLHSREFGRENETLLKEIDRIHPDGILIGGDMMVCKKTCDLRVTLALVKRLASKYPVYYANGNHEERMKREREKYGERYPYFVKQLRRAGVHYLTDSGECFGSDIRITGCNLKERYYRHHFTVPKLEEGELSRVGKADRERFQILLLHSPLFFEDCCRWGADLTLCGHFHGGTIRLPFLGGVMTPQYQFFLPCCAGRFDKDGKTMIVGRGLGTHSINIRLNDRPQLVWVTVAGT
ncbi:MAG: metallophosphoesterase [Clostridium sp.]|nr:metallophosphoesterase [Clostridium sp.]